MKSDVTGERHKTEVDLMGRKYVVTPRLTREKEHEDELLGCLDNSQNRFAAYKLGTNHVSSTVSKKQLRGETKSVIFVSFLVGFISVILAFFVKRFIMVESVSIPFLDVVESNNISIYLTQLSLTFITVSVCSTLSDSSVIIFWENVVEKRLIIPKWTCFFAYSTYAFATIVFGAISLAVGLNVLFLAYFVIDICVLMLLSMSMIDVYFNRNKKMARLQIEYNKCKDDSVKRDAMQKLYYNTVRAIEEKDYRTITENFDFYSKNISELTFLKIVSIFDNYFALNMSSLYLAFVNKICRSESGYMLFIFLYLLDYDRFEKVYRENRYYALEMFDSICGAVESYKYEKRKDDFPRSTMDKKDDILFSSYFGDSLLFSSVFVIKKIDYCIERIFELTGEAGN